MTDDGGADGNGRAPTAREQFLADLAEARRAAADATSRHGPTSIQAFDAHLVSAGMTALVADILEMDRDELDATVRRLL